MSLLKLFGDGQKENQGYDVEHGYLDVVDFLAVGHLEVYIILFVGGECLDAQGVVWPSFGETQNFLGIPDSLKVLGTPSFVRVVLFHGVPDTHFDLWLLVSPGEVQQFE